MAVIHCKTDDDFNDAMKEIHQFIKQCAITDVTVMNVLSTAGE